MDLPRLISVFLYTDFATILFKYKEFERMFKTWAPKLFLDKGAGSRATHDKLIVSGILNSLNYSVICVVYAHFRGEQWQTTPKNLPRMQRIRAIPVA